MLVNEISGTSAGDVLTGTDGNDLIQGFEGRDEIIGGAGDDTLIGGVDGDLLTGGGGSDQFIFNAFEERRDLITDFDVNQDQIVLTNLFLELEYSVDKAISEGYIRFVQAGLNTKIQIDHDGVESAPFRTLVIVSDVAASDLKLGNNLII
ncbi:type I secretion C-terminal target domain-containing protein [Lyngbya aestuarii]|uniref:type I secretion C-terminal target domain-containing protein n=1 Tax=Lyngbya aestuarii TaxID=118322 RepID=UPI00403DB44E